MKKFLFHVNRGILLFAIVCLAVTVYLLTDMIQNQKKEKDIRAITTQYIEDSCSCYVFPEGFDVGDPESFFYSYNLSTATKELAEEAFIPVKHYYVDNKALQDEFIGQIQNMFLYDIDAESMPISCSRIPGRMKIRVYRDSATVEVDCSTVVEYIDASGIRSSYNNTTTEYYEYVCIDGEWKLVYNSLSGLVDYYGY